ncbi:hypothetical protein [Aliihoeflea sp. 40Bstr573]|uniref:hypothetical protein n=1 Tax=Aliihoeflea sp. 40Bstr573 TaxID=2696467 RepID=UPI002094BCCE|nr:hypothetical protein [Aliihoeflea sp. 40Bstr573]MCO6386232.1 hypothetical protein [Aliihoeflea sp. 40Bstr573]
MKIGDITALMGHIAPVIREFTEGLVDPIAARMAAVEKTVKDFRVPKDGEKGQDGKDGRDGVDGLGFDDLDVVHDGARGFTFRFARGDQVKEFPFTLPVVLDKGVYKAGDDYEPGDGVTYGGSFWIAQEKTAEKPDSGKGWRLAVKRGRDGKSAPVAASGAKEPIRVGVPAKAN